MAIAEGTLPAGTPAGSAPGARNTAAGLSLIGAVTGAAFVLFLLVGRDLLTPLGIVVGTVDVPKDKVDTNLTTSLVITF